MHCPLLPKPLMTFREDLPPCDQLLSTSLRMMSLKWPWLPSPFMGEHQRMRSSGRLLFPRWPQHLWWT